MSSNNPSSERPPYIEELRAEGRGLPYRPAKRKKRPERELPSPEDSHRLFNVEKGNRWLELARREPAAKMLFGELWHQGELCMLFADTNTGKSVLAVQIGESIARGQSITPFTCQAPPASVLYIDFELSQSQFGLRYSQGDEDHLFPDNFYRAQYNFIPDPPPNVDENELLIAGIEFKINRVKATVLIIDNITCLRGGTENSLVALSLMKRLKALQTDYKLSILVLAHTPKRRNPTQPISADDLHGSKLLINFADSAFAIGQSTVPRTPHGADTGLCYLKQIKQRNTRQRYGHDNVCLCRIQKPGTFLHFAFEGFSAEHHHLLSRTAAYRQQMANKIATLAADGLSQREISDQLGVPLTSVNRLLKYADVQMRGCADEKEFENLKMGKFEDGGGCADEKEFENLKMRRFEDEEGCVPHVRDAMRECAGREGCADDPMTNDVMTNDQKGCADEEDCLYNGGFPVDEECEYEDEFEDEGEFADDETWADALMTNDQNEFTEMQAPENTGAESRSANSLPQEGSIQRIVMEEGLPGYADPPPVSPGERQAATPRLNYDPARTLKISTIDKLLTPELLDHILRTTTPENSICGKGTDRFNHPDTLMDTPAKNSDP